MARQHRPVVIYSPSLSSATAAARVLIAEADTRRNDSEEKCDTEDGIRTTKNYVHLSIDVVELSRQGDFVCVRRRIQELFSGMSPPTYLVITGMEIASKPYIDKTVALILRPPASRLKCVVVTDNLSRVPRALRCQCVLERVPGESAASATCETNAAEQLYRMSVGGKFCARATRDMVSNIVSRRLSVPTYLEMCCRCLSEQISADKVDRVIESIVNLTRGLEKGHNRAHHLELFVVSLLTELQDGTGISSA